MNPEAINAIPAHSGKLRTKRTGHSVCNSVETPTFRLSPSPQHKFSVHLILYETAIPGPCVLFLDSKPQSLVDSCPARVWVCVVVETQLPVLMNIFDKGD